MTAQLDVEEALAHLEAWLDTHDRDRVGGGEPGPELRRHVALMRAEAERLRNQLED
jgi:hypothetical protein